MSAIKNKITPKPDDRLVGEGVLGTIFLHRNGKEVGCVSSGMKLCQDVRGFSTYAEVFAKNFCLRARHTDNPWVKDLSPV